MRLLALWLKTELANSGQEREGVPVPNVIDPESCANCSQKVCEDPALGENYCPAAKSPQVVQMVLLGILYLSCRLSGQNPPSVS